MQNNYQKTIPFVSFMRVQDVRNYMNTKALVAVNFTGLDFYASIEHVKPYQEIKEEHKLVKTSDLFPLMTQKATREMECEVVTQVDEARWYFKISDELK